MSWEYSENILVQNSAGKVLKDKLGWEVVFANFPYPWYITRVRNSLWIEWEKRRPAGNVLSAMVSFAIARDGKIKDLKIERKSGDDTFDFAASSAVINAGPFAPLPMYYEKDELTVTVEFKQEK